MQLSSTRLLFARNFIFGAEDSLVSTVGLLSGVAVSGMAKPQIILTGIVLIFVEAFSMGVGSFLSEYSAEESGQDKPVSKAKSLWGALIMMISYLIVGLIPLAPYVLFESNSFLISVAFSLVALFVLGYVSAIILHIPVLKSSIRMLVIGGLAVFVGVVVSSLVKIA